MKMKTYMTKSRMLLSCIHLIHGKKFLLKVIPVCGCSHINAKRVDVFCFYISFLYVTALKKIPSNVMCLFCAISCFRHFLQSIDCIWHNLLARNLSRRCWRRHITTYRWDCYRISGELQLLKLVLYIFIYVPHHSALLHLQSVSCSTCSSNWVWFQ